VERHRRGRLARRNDVGGGPVQRASVPAPGTARFPTPSAAPSSPDILDSTMRLTSDEIEFLARKIIKTLVAEGKLEVDSETRVMGDLVKVITEEMSVEDRLNEEVRGVLMQHAAEMERSNMSYTDMFKMLKKKMAKEKGIIL
jgi:polyhydroxyalkanoate synthesis regulator phasin